MEVLFIKFNYVDMLNQYLTNIFTMKNNIQNLYFNVKGEGRSSFSKSLEDDISNFNKFYDNLSFLIKKIGGYPILSLEEIKSISTIKEIPSQDYTVLEAKNILIKDLNIINNMNNQVFEYALKNYDLSSINLVLDFNKYLGRRVGILKIS